MEHDILKHLLHPPSRSSDLTLELCKPEVESHDQRNVGPTQMANKELDDLKPPTYLSLNELKCEKIVTDDLQPSPDQTVQYLSPLRRRASSTNFIRTYLKCPHCPYKSLYDGCVARHIINNCKGDRSSCEICCKRNNVNICAMIKHLREVHSLPIPVSYQQRYDHIRKAHKCHLCRYSTKRARDLLRHLDVHARRATQHQREINESNTRLTCSLNNTPIVDNTRIASVHDTGFGNDIFCWVNNVIL